MAFYCFYFIFYQKMQPWWSYVHKKYQKRRHDGGWRLRWKITGERLEATRWSCLHIKGCPDMFWHSPGSPQPHLRILKWRGGTSWHRSPGCQTCFGFLLPWALNIQHIPTQTQCTRSAALHCIPGNNTTPTFLFPQHSLPDNTTRTIFRSGLFQLSALHGFSRNDLLVQAWQLQERNSNSQRQMRQNWAIWCFPTFGELRIWIFF